jgi:hypothetical protein
MPQQRIRVKTSGSPDNEKQVDIDVTDEDAERLDELDGWVSDEKKAKRKIEDSHLQARLSPTSSDRRVTPVRCAECGTEAYEAARAGGR